jgi:beta-galactosidase
MSRPGPTVATQNAGAGGVETLTFPSVVNRYIRLLGITRAMAYGYSLFEFQVYGADIPAILTEPASQTVNSSSTATFSATVGGDGPFTYQWLRNGVAIPGATTTSYATPAVMSADSGSTFAIAVTNASATSTSISATLTVNSSAPTRPNLALNQPATSSGNENAGLGPANAVDGNATTRWSSAFVDPSWLQVDLGSPMTIGQVVIQWQNAYGTAYQIQVSNDQLAWTTVYSESNGTGGVENITFPPSFVQNRRDGGRRRYSFS